MPYELLPWIDESKLTNEGLSWNTNAIDYLTKHPEKIDWGALSCNKSAVPLLEANLDKIDWEDLQWNENAVNILLDHPEKINWSHIGINKNVHLILEKYPERIDCIDSFDLSANPNCIDILKQRPDKMDFSGLLQNPNACQITKEELIDPFEDLVCIHRKTYKKEDISELSQNPDKINWYRLSVDASPEAIQLIEKYADQIDKMDKVKWNYLSINEHAIPLLKKFPERIDWESLNSNLNGIDILKDYPDKINWDALSSKPRIFEYKELRSNL